MTKDNFFIITGGPGGGKTSLLEYLSSTGIPYVPETARTIIKDRISKGLSPRPDPKTFALEIFFKDYSNFVSNLNLQSPLFFDRSFMDSACQLFMADISAYNEIKNTYRANRYNNKVFITPPWEEIYRNDTERDQTFEEAVDVYEKLHKWYGSHDYEVIDLPKDTIEARAAFILSRVSN